MQIARSVTKKLHLAMLPYEDDIYKFEDLVFFLNPEKTLFFFISINIPFIILYFAHLSFYSIIFIFQGLYFASYCSDFKAYYSIFLEKKINDIESELNFKRFNIAQISALIGTCFFTVLFFLQRSLNGLFRQNMKVILETLFFLILFFSFFFMISDLFLCWVTMHIILLLPLLLQKNLIRLIDIFQYKIICILFPKEMIRIERKEKIINFPKEKRGSEEDIIECGEASVVEEYGFDDEYNQFNIKIKKNDKYKQEGKLNDNNKNENETINNEIQKDDERESEASSKNEKDS